MGIDKVVVRAGVRVGSKAVVVECLGRFLMFSFS